MAYLVLVRHGESSYNERGVWTGWEDPDVTEKGESEAREAGLLLKDIHFNLGFVSALKRTLESMKTIKGMLHQDDLPIITSQELNERNYGVYTGENKWDIRKSVGDEEFLQIRRGWDHEIPQGESLKDVYDRAVPYFKNEILPKLKENKNIIICSSGNTLRALVKYLENVSDAAITTLEFATGEIYVYTIDSQGDVINKEVRHHRENTA